MKSSVATIKKFFGRNITEQDAVALRAVLAAVDVKSHRSVDDTLKTANRLIGGYGVEVLRGKYVNSYYGDIVAEYVNVGDSYAATLLFNTVTSRFSLTSWGDFVEKNAKRYKID
jgi:hypothetical protein